MYERYFGFEEKPFALIPDPAFLYLSRQHADAFTLLEYGILNQAGFIVVTGEVGCGKTTLIRHLLNRLPDHVRVGLISNTHQRFANLLEWVLMSFGVDYKAKTAVALYESFVDFLITEYAKRRRVILIIDEAQNLGAATLEELRTLSNINVDKHLVLQIMLVGQPELRETLMRPELRQFLQRVVGHYHLEPLDQEETKNYIQHRLTRAGGSQKLFTEEACRLVHRHSGGVPRLVNLLCDTALVYAYGEDVKLVGAVHVEAVITDGAAGMSPVSLRQAAGPHPGDAGSTTDSARAGGLATVTQVKEAGNSRRDAPQGDFSDAEHPPGSRRRRALGDESSALAAAGRGSVIKAATAALRPSRSIIETAMDRQANDSEDSAEVREDRGL